MASPVSELLRRYDLRAKKSFGQCFLHDPALIRRIVDVSEVGSTDSVIEIGAGLGVLTRMLAERAGRVVALERDRDLAQILRAELSTVPRLEIVETNALTYDYAALGQGVRIVGNLPYNIASQILFRVLEQSQAITSATFMVQREFAERLTAKPGSKAYGVPTVICASVAEVRYCFDVGAGAFIPAPRVDSAVVHLTFRAAPLGSVDLQKLKSVVRVAFARRRKTLLRALTAEFPEAAARQALERAGIDRIRRAETLSLDEFARLTTQLFPPEPL
jgi:16S rRNA (adenine1518-N6/adenine1519-N6)-dimethyltransferase